MISPAYSNTSDDQSSFLASVGHELRNPLSCVLAHAETLQDGLHGAVTPAQSAVLQTIQNDVRRTLALITDLADLGRIEANALVLHPGPCHLQIIQQQAIELSASTALARSIRITAEPAPDASIQTDEARLRQLVSELLSAALLSAPLGGEAWLALSYLGASIQIQAGTGLTRIEFDRLSLPLMEDPAVSDLLRRLLSLKPLGMSLIRKLVQLLGGVFAAQVTPGGAVRLMVHLPLVPNTTPPAVRPEAALSPRPLPSASIAPLNRAPVILLADDQPTLVSVTTHYLENLGFGVHNARDGQEAILQTQKLRPDLILMDVRMPLLEGPQAIQAIRGSNDPYMRSVPIISLSGQPGPADRERCLSAGATDHLSKPFGVKELDAAIRQFVTPPG